MAYTAPATAVTGDVLTAAWGNTYIRDNMLETGVAKVTTAEDLLVATGANALKRLAKGTDTHALTMVSGAVAWGAIVNSVFGRTGAVVSAAGDYTVSQITGALSRHQIDIRRAMRV